MTEGEEKGEAERREEGDLGEEGGVEAEWA